MTVGAYAIDLHVCFDHLKLIYTDDTYTAHTHMHVACTLYTCTHTHNVLSVMENSHLAAMTLTEVVQA